MISAARMLAGTSFEKDYINAKTGNVRIPASFYKSFMDKNAGKLKDGKARTTESRRLQYRKATYLQRCVRTRAQQPCAWRGASRTRLPAHAPVARVVVERLRRDVRACLLVRVRAPTTGTTTWCRATS